MLTFDTSRLTPVERAALDMRRQSAQSAPEAEPPTIEEFLQMHANHLLEMAVKEYVAGQLPSLQPLAVQFLNCTPERRAEVLSLLDAPTKTVESSAAES